MRRRCIHVRSVEPNLYRRIAAIERFYECSRHACEGHRRSGLVRISYESRMNCLYRVRRRSNLVHVHRTNLTDDVVGSVSVEDEDVVDVAHAAGASVILIRARRDRARIHRVFVSITWASICFNFYKKWGPPPSFFKVCAS